MVERIVDVDEVTSSILVPPTMEVPKRKVAVLVPYYTKDGKSFVFLQKRSKDAKILPNFFGFFGGGIDEGETPEQAVRREIKEELVYEMKDYKFFNHFEHETHIKDVFIMLVEKSFEEEVTVLEGDYGQWFSKEEAEAEPLISEDGKFTLKKFFEYLGE